MSDSMLGEDPQATAQALTGALKDMTRQLAQVKTTVRRSKRVIIAIVVSLLLDVALTAIVSVAAVQANDASAKANATVAGLHSTQVNACRAGNQTRAASIQLWDHIVAISRPAPGSTRAQIAAQQHKLTAFLAYVRKTYAPRNCVRLYRVP